MINSKELFNQFIRQIRLAEGRGEIASIGYVVFESVFGISKADILRNRLIESSPYFDMRMSEIAARLNANEPIQYILGKADFFGRQFKVNGSVLIPRPETEELVHLILNRCARTTHPKIVDIGTGTGCIAITLSLELPGADVYATDISDEALKIAAQNNHILEGRVKFIRHDILSEPFVFNDVDMLVSNPPYIAPEEIGSMQKNVTDFEPHVALFTPGNDPLIFYKAIAEKAVNALKPAAIVATEINERFGKDVSDVFVRAGLSDVVVVKDISGKERFVVGVKE